MMPAAAWQALCTPSADEEEQPARLEERIARAVKEREVLRYDRLRAEIAKLIRLYGWAAWEAMQDEPPPQMHPPRQRRRGPRSPSISFAKDREWLVAARDKWQGGATCWAALYMVGTQMGGPSSADAHTRRLIARLRQLRPLALMTTEAELRAFAAAAGNSKAKFPDDILVIEVAAETAFPNSAGPLTWDDYTEFKRWGELLKTLL
jgi:hypothetical protein